MRRMFVAIGALLLVVSCTNDRRPTTAPSSSSAAAPTTRATPPPSTAVTTTTTSGLAPIAGCPDPGPLAPPDPQRPGYRATVAVDMASSTVTGSLEVRFTPDLDTNELVFRLWPNAPVLAASGVHEDAGPVTRDDGVVLATVQPDPTTLHAALPATLRAGETVTVTMPFTLSVPGNNEDRVARDGDTLRLGSFLPLLAWEPSVGWATDPPTSVHAEAATSPAADYDVTVTAPDGYEVLGTGEHRSDGRFVVSSVRDFALVVGHFASLHSDVGGTSVTVAVATSAGDDPQRYMDLIADALPRYEARLGRYPWITYTAVVLPGFHGGIEFPTLVMHGSGSTERSIVHELAHQWFYSVVGNDQGRDPWLDEGLASYAEFVQVGSLARHAADAIPSGAAGHAGESMPYWENRASSYYAGVYVQSAEAIASLGTVDQVDCALRQYVARFAFRIARPADLFAALAAVFPDAAVRLAPYGLHP